jgi:hypothetical protein
VWIGAVLLAALGIANLVIAGQPWGIVYGPGLWGAKLVTWLGADLTGNAFWGRAAQQAQIAAPALDDVTTITNLGLLAGAMMIAARRGTAPRRGPDPGAAVARRDRGRPGAGLQLAARVRLQRRRVLLGHLVGQRARLGVVRRGLRRLHDRHPAARAAGHEGMSR